VVNRLTTAVTKGRLEGLRALRDSLAQKIEHGDNESGAAALARQLRETLREIDSLESALPTGSVVDDLAARRTHR
jgi:hypothetical protein